jgi:pimeloyl-ACP methyl ester carboxylesterase
MGPDHMGSTAAGSIATVDGLSIHRRAAVTMANGPTPTVVFVHGAADRGAAFSRVGRHLPEAHLVRYDRRGYGRSVGATPPAVTTGSELLGAQIDDLEAVLDATVTEGPVVVVGHSVGGLIGLGAAMRQPESVDAVVAYEPPTPWQPWWGSGQAGASARTAASSASDGDPAIRGAAAMEAFLRRMIGDDRWDALGPRVQAARHAEGPALLADLDAARGAADLDLTAMRVPVVLGVGTATTDRHRRAIAYLAGLVASAEVVTLEGAAHGAHMTHPAGFAHMVQRALGRLAP